ncbi:hypothetical protein [Aquabacter sediminis]|uniref:hypothetical protein n=1 Tax=Aquabacter sediminis TaxID=3029197 RepID=UPI00237E5D28|nr:hypothetical protein [Aquabacter sp. P-9]MDE1567794.1 hypothetical protein [Aquabacter sp. P-9]
MKKTSILAFAATVSVSLAAHAAPILPAQDKAGDVNTYQALAPADRMATLEAFTGKAIRPGSVFDNLDACTLRATTEPSAGSMRLSKVIPACEKELGY